MTPIRETGSLRTATEADDELIARHFLATWREAGVPAEAVLGDAHARIHAFLAEARAGLGFAAFVAEADGAPVGSAACQFYRAPYPDVLAPSHRRYGYIWGVYVEPAWRRRGIARRLTAATLDHLRALGCTRALLNASPEGRLVYAGMGFQPSTEMRLDLADQA